MATQQDEDPRYGSREAQGSQESHLSSQQWRGYWTTDGVALRDHFATYPATPQPTGGPPPPQPYHALDISEIDTQGPAALFTPSPNAPAVHFTNAPVETTDEAEITADLGARFSSSWPPVAPPSDDIARFSPTVRDLAPQMGQPTPMTVPFPEEWPETLGGRVRRITGGAVQWGAEVVRRTTTPPPNAQNPHSDPHFSARQRDLNRAWLGGPVTEEEAQELRDDLATIQWNHEVKVLKRYFHAPYEPEKSHCRFCGEASGMVRCRRAGLPHDALIWLCFECQKHTIASNETDARRKGCGLPIALERDFRSRLNILTDLPVARYDEFLKGQPGQQLGYDQRTIARRRTTLS